MCKHLLLCPALLACIAILGSAAASQHTCSNEAQSRALQDMYANFGGAEWHRADSWPDTLKACVIEGIELPAHCCWHGVECCTHEQCSGGQRQHRDACGCEVGLVLSIRLSSNKLVGNFSVFNHLAFVCELRTLNLANNALYGEINQDFTEYRKIVSLELHDNNFQGGLPTGIGAMSSLESFWIHGNSLEGPLPSDICGNSSRLVSIFLDDNTFSGPLDLSLCVRLQLFGAKDNRFDNIFAQNRGLPELRGLYLENNGLRGSLPGTLFMDFLPRLEHIHLFKNQLTGRLPEMSMFTFSYISLSSNYLVGEIPSSWARVTRPSAIVDLTSNYFSCCGVDPLPPHELEEGTGLRIDEVYKGMNYSAPFLPPFLEQTDNLEPVPIVPGQGFNALGLRCPRLKQRGTSDDQASMSTWLIDPAYYLFRNCVCEKGFEFVNLTKPGRLFYMECQSYQSRAAAERRSWASSYPWAVVIIVVVSCALMGLLLVGLYLYKGTEVVQKITNIQKRMKGLPSSGPFAAVVTDIQGWTALCAQHPELSDEVLSIHNAILRHAKWCNFGRTHQTEGDSFTVVFYDAKDAAAFCLQAQQLLDKQQWPSLKGTQCLEDESTPLSSDVRASNTAIPKKSRRFSTTLLHTFSRTLKLHDSGECSSLDIRVRMGIASGFLHSGEPLHSHPVIEVAKEVSDCAFGGQILMDCSTFAAIRDSLGELGSVDTQGMHVDRLRARRLLGWSASLFGPLAKPSKSRQDAFLLDMGCFVNPKAKEEAKQAKRPDNKAFQTELASQPDKLHLYQLISATNAERSKAWGSHSRVKNEWNLKDSISKAYFDAPGTLIAPLGATAIPAPAMPILTMVFARVENAKVLSSKSMSQVERLLLTCTSRCLDQVEGDGYLCRVFEGLKLMLCFSKPQAAISWSCAMQECMMRMAWPSSAMKEPFHSVYDKGNLVFRGPRLKIGISEGRPTSIQPDHMGRADYHGDFVNSAARFMDGAAWGGLIVCEQELATKAMEAWSSSHRSEEGVEQLHLAENVYNSPFFLNLQSPQSQRSRRGDIQDGPHWSHAGCAGNMQPSQSGSLKAHNQCLVGSTRGSAPVSKGLLPKSKQDQLSRLLASNDQSHSAPLPALLSPQSKAACQQGLNKEASVPYHECLKNVHMIYLGLYRFKGISCTKRMVHVLQEELAPRAVAFPPKPASLASATLISQLQPSGPAVSTYLVPMLPVVLDPWHTVQENTELLSSQ